MTVSFYAVILKGEQPSITSPSLHRVMAAVNLGRDEVKAEFILAPINLREIGDAARARLWTYL